MNASLRRIGTATFIIILAALDSGCGPEDVAPVPLCSYLPEPAVVPGVPRPERAPLTLEAALRKCECEKFVGADYQAKGYRIVATTEKPSGQIMDWMAGETVPGSEQPTPPPLVDDYQPRPGVERGKTELEMYPELKGPPGTVGIPRMTFPAYVNGETGASSLEEYLLQKSAQQHQPPGQDRLYAGYKLKNISLGAFGVVNAFAGPIEDNTFSLMEIAVQCINPYSGGQEFVGIAASRDRRNFDNSGGDDSSLRLQVEYYIYNPNAVDPEPKEKGGWHGGEKNAEGFKWIVNHPYHPNEPIQGSAVGGKQYEHSFRIAWWDEKWWLAYQGQWFGYYPANLFEEISTYACEVSWYMEVFDGNQGPWTSTDGGSGEFAQAGAPNAAYFKQLTYLDTQFDEHWLLKNAAWGVLPYNPACYTATPMEFTWTPGAENGFYCGGSGNDPIKAPSCTSVQ